MSKDKMPLLIGGGVIGIVLIGLLIFLGVRALGGEDEPTANPTNGQPAPTGGNQSPGADNGQLGEASGQAKTATEKLQSNGYGCADLFNTGQGAHRGCFKSDAGGTAEAVFQFLPDGNITGVRIQAENRDNVNNAKVMFDMTLQALGNDTFGGGEVKKVQDAVNTGQSRQRIGSSWGEFQLSNSGERLELSGRKSGSDNLELPRKTLQTSDPQLLAGLKAKGYECKNTCRKPVGKYGSVHVSGSSSASAGLSWLSIDATGDPDDVKQAVPGAVKDTFAVVKGADANALKAYLEANPDGKSAVAYVSGWRIEIDSTLGNANFGSLRISITNESFYV